MPLGRIVLAIGGLVLAVLVIAVVGGSVGRLIATAMQPQIACRPAVDDRYDGRGPDPPAEARLRARDRPSALAVARLDRARGPAKRRRIRSRHPAAAVPPRCRPSLRQWSPRRAPSSPDRAAGPFPDVLAPVRRPVQRRWSRSRPTSMSPRRAGTRAVHGRRPRPERDSALDPMPVPSPPARRLGLAAAGLTGGRSSSWRSRRLGAIPVIPGPPRPGSRPRRRPRRARSTAADGGRGRAGCRSAGGPVRTGPPGRPRPTRRDGVIGAADQRPRPARGTTPAVPQRLATGEGSADPGSRARTNGDTGPAHAGRRPRDPRGRRRDPRAAPRRHPRPPPALRPPPPRPCPDATPTPRPPPVDFNVPITGVAVHLSNRTKGAASWVW